MIDRYEKKEIQVKKLLSVWWLSRNVVGGASIFFPIGAGALLACNFIVHGAVPQVPAASLCKFAGTNRANECSGKTCFGTAECSRFRA